MNYDDRIICDYIAGKEITNIDSLESNEEFVIEVMDKVRSMNSYELLGKKDKLEYKIVKYLITKYALNREFTLYVAGNYFDHKEFDVEDIEYIELLILMNKYKKKTDVGPKEDAIKLKLDTFYNTICKYALNRVKEEAKKDNKMVRYYGTGYTFIQKKYENSSLIKNYVAERRINEIFADYRMLETYIHDNFNSKEDFADIGAHRFVIDYTYQIDTALCRYLTCNTNLLNDIVSIIFKIINHWERYNIEKKDNICEFISECCDKTMPREISKRQVFNYLGKKYNIKELIDYVDVIDKENDDDIACYIYVNNIDDEKEVQEAIKRKNLKPDDFPIITEEKNLKKDKLSSETVSWLDRLERLVSNLYDSNEIEEDNIVPFKPKKS